MTESPVSAPRSSWWSEWSMPILIFCGVAVLFFLLARMVSQSSDYKSLVQELDSKTFGNKWVAAYELSKIVNASAIAPEDLPWFMEQLSSIYRSQGQDPRTRHFIMVTLSALQNVQTIPVLTQALNDPDPQVGFSAVVGLGQLMPLALKENVERFPWQKLGSLMRQSDDSGIKRILMISFAQVQHPGEKPYFESKMTAEPSDLDKLYAAIGLVYYNDPAGVSVLKDFWDPQQRQTHQQAWNIDDQLYQQLQLNFLSALHRLSSEGIPPHKAFQALLEQFLSWEDNTLVRTKIQESLLLF